MGVDLLHFLRNGSSQNESIPILTFVYRIYEMAKATGSVSEMELLWWSFRKTETHPYLYENALGTTPVLSETR